MKIAPLSNIKTGYAVVIDKIESSDNPNINRRLSDLGFVPGRDIVIVGKFGDKTYKVRVDNDNPIGIDNTLTDRIFVQAEDGDIFVSSKKSSILYSLKGIFTKK